MYIQVLHWVMLAADTTHRHKNSLADERHIPASFFFVEYSKYSVQNQISSIPLSGSKL